LHGDYFGVPSFYDYFQLFNAFLKLPVILVSFGGFEGLNALRLGYNKLQISYVLGIALHLGGSNIPPSLALALGGAGNFGW
jgi:hypothetical protein